jgi:AcrR family transcriptional regulator
MTEQAKPRSPHLSPTNPPVSDLHDPALSDRVVYILTQAAAMFAERGYERTSMRDLADQCGISKSLLYHHFSDKEALYARIALGFTREMHEFVAGRIPADVSVSEKVRHFMIASAEFFERHRLVWIASTAAFWSDPDLRRQGERIVWRDHYEGLLRTLLAEGVARGELRAMDVPIAGRLILSALNWMHRWYKPGEGLDAAQIAEMYHGMVFGGLNAPVIAQTEPPAVRARRAR